MMILCAHTADATSLSKSASLMGHVRAVHARHSLTRLVGHHGRRSGSANSGRFIYIDIIYGTLDLRADFVADGFRGADRAAMLRAAARRRLFDSARARGFRRQASRRLAKRGARQAISHAGARHVSYADVAHAHGSFARCASERWRHAR